MKLTEAPVAKTRSVIHVAPMHPGEHASKCKTASIKWKETASKKSANTAAEAKMNQASVAQIGGMTTHLGGDSSRERIVCAFSDKVAGAGPGDVHTPDPEQALYMCKVNLEGRRLRLAEVVANPASKGGGLGDLFLWASDQKRVVGLDAATVGLVDYYGRFGFTVSPGPKANHFQKTIQDFEAVKAELLKLNQQPESTRSAETVEAIKKLTTTFADMKFQQIDLAMEARPEDIKAKVAESASYQAIVEPGGEIASPAAPPASSASKAAAAAASSPGGMASMLASIKKPATE
jgi:hypothetical protein